MHRWNQRGLSRIIAVAALALSAIAPFVPAAAGAVGFNQSYLRINRMKVSTLTDGTVCAMPSAAGNVEAFVSVTFPTGFVLNSFGTWTVNTTDIPAGSTAWTGITTTGGSISGQTITFGSGNLASAAVLYCFNFSASVTTDSVANPSLQAKIETKDSGSAVLDSTQVALALLTDDQIQVTATVPPSFIFVLGANADAFPLLSPAAGAPGIKSTTGVTVTITTNAKGGWITWARDQYQGLHSATANYTIPTVGTLSSGTYASGVPDGTPSTINGGVEGYVLDTDITTDATGGCTVAIASEYNGATTAQGGSLMGNYQQIAKCDTGSPATANGDVITLIERATISAATPAASDYVDVITVVGAGNF